MNTSGGMDVKIVTVDNRVPDVAIVTVKLIDVRIRALKQELSGLEKLREEITKRD